MRTLIFGAGPLGSLYAYLLHKAGKDVTILARNERFRFLKEKGVVLVNEFSGQKESAPVKVIEQLDDNDSYDMVAVFVRKNKIKSVLESLRGKENLKNIMFMGNNVLGFDDYLDFLPKEKILFGFGGAGGGVEEQVVHYVDSKEHNGKRLPIMIGEMDGQVKERTQQIEELFQSAAVPVDISTDIDSWYKYHVAFVFPMCGVLVHNESNNYKLAENEEDMRCYIRGVNEAGRVLKKLSITKEKPIPMKLFKWLPEFMVVKKFKEILSTKFAEVAFAKHAGDASDEFLELAEDFKTLSRKAAIETPNLDKITGYFDRG